MEGLFGFAWLVLSILCLSLDVCSKIVFDSDMLTSSPGVLSWKCSGNDKRDGGAVPEWVKPIYGSCK